MKISPKGMMLSALPNAVMLALFYSLAVHLYWKLGGWPEAIGTRGFPPLLIFHGDIARHFFIALIWFGIFIWPLATVICLMSRDCRRAVPYLALYALFFFGCWGLMRLAPEPFAYWWWD